MIKLFSNKIDGQDKERIYYIDEKDVNHAINLLREALIDWVDEYDSYPIQKDADYLFGVADQMPNGDRVKEIARRLFHINLAVGSMRITREDTNLDKAV